MKPGSPALMSSLSFESKEIPNERHQACVTREEIYWDFIVAFSFGLPAWIFLSILPSPKKILLSALCVTWLILYYLIGIWLIVIAHIFLLSERAFSDCFVTSFSVQLLNMLGAFNGCKLWGIMRVSCSPCSCLTGVSSFLPLPFICLPVLWPSSLDPVPSTPPPRPQYSLFASHELFVAPVPLPLHSCCESSARKQGWRR